MFCTAFALLLSVSPAAAKLPAVSTPHIQRADAANVSALPSPGAKDHSEDWRVFDFVTRPDIIAPKWNIRVFHHDRLSDGHWFVAPYAELKQTKYPVWNGPYIYKDNGELIWSGIPAFHHLNTFDFRTVEDHDERRLRLIDPAAEHHAGVILDERYEIVNTVDLRGDLDTTNMHDFTVVDNAAHALTLTRVPGEATREESLEVGFNGICQTGWEGFRELDVQTSEILYDWNPHGHISLNETTLKVDTIHNMCSNGWDILHLNSIDKFPDGDYLLSSRHTDTIYKVSHRDGSVVWRLGGTRSDFEVEKSGVFSRQHHARVQGQNATHILISLFDNARGDTENDVRSHAFSRGLLLGLELDATPKKAKLLAHFNHPDRRITNSRGSLQFLPNGNAFLGWTYGSLISEHSPDGEILMRAHLNVPGAHTYRAFKLPWVGRPSEPPAVRSIVNSTHGRLHSTIHVSWNGATEVSTWKSYGTNAAGNETHLLASSPHQGFESIISYPGYSEHVIVEAYDSSGKSLGSSAITQTVAEPGVNVLAEEGISWSASVIIFLTVAVCTVLTCSWYLVGRRKGWRLGLVPVKEVQYARLAKEDNEETEDAIPLKDNVRHQDGIT